MRLRLIIVFLAIVLVPLGVLAYLGTRLVRDEEQIILHQLKAVQQQRLGDLERTALAGLEELERRLVQQMELPAIDTEQLRELARKEPLFRQTFAISSDGRLLHPPVSGEMTAAERAFLTRTKPIWNRDAVLYSPPRSEASAVSGTGPGGGPRERPGSGDSILDLAERAGHGWISWYWEEGLHLLFWRRHPGGGVVGAEVERVVLLSRILGRLPAPEVRDGRIVLADLRGDAVYQWGSAEAQPRTGHPEASVQLDYPLDFLRLDYFSSQGEQVEQLLGSTLRFNLMAGLGAIALALMVLATYFYREYTRDLRDAAQRVSFVTQVSHELKTPLTNIRLYAELLENELDEDNESAGRRLGVIVSESQRLTRLINNILTFSKQRGGALKINRAPAVVDEVVQSVLGQFGPLLAAKGIAASFEPRAERPVLVDRDALGQIVANLVSNVEKYAASGGVVQIETAQANGETIVTVRDRGPGIPPQHRERIFEPFYRISDKLADGVTGTGIGLTIARELARLHGGDLVLAASEQGACFQLTLRGEAT